MKNDLLRVAEISAILLTLFALSDVHALDYPYISSPTGQYMGEISDDHLRRDSISNEFGRYGSELSPDSIHNSLGQFGSEFSSESPYYIGRPGSLERPESRRQSRRLQRELETEYNWLE